METCEFIGCKQKTIFEWKIDEFPLIMKYSMHNQVAHTIISLDFPTDWKFKWQLELKFNNVKKSEDKEWISIFINSRSDSAEHIFKVKYSLFIFENKNEKKFQQKSYKVFKGMENFCITKFLEVNQLLEEKDKLLLYNALTLCIELTEFTESSYGDSPTTKIPLKISNHQIIHHLEDLFDSKEGSDVVLVVDDKKIPAHKTLLMSRSPVFSAMITHQLNENKENEVTIPDMDPDTCEKLFEFIYTDNVTNLHEFSERLYEVADKYQLPTLKELCEESFCKNVKVENAVKYLVLLDRNNTDERFFKYNILDFIAFNSKEIIETPEFKALEKAVTELSFTIGIKICSIKKINRLAS